MHRAGDADVRNFLADLRSIRAGGAIEFPRAADQPRQNEREAQQAQTIALCSFPVLMWRYAPIVPIHTIRPTMARQTPKQARKPITSTAVGLLASNSVPGKSFRLSSAAGFS